MLLASDMALLDEKPCTMQENAAMLSDQARTRLSWHLSAKVSKPMMKAMSSAGQMAEDSC